MNRLIVTLAVVATGAQALGGGIEPNPHPGYVGVQVSTDACGNNIIGDAANEPSIAIDPTDPNRIVIGWRQFDSIESDFRQAGIAFSHDGGWTWLHPALHDEGTFSSDPVLACSSDGEFYHFGIELLPPMIGRFSRSTDGVSWSTILSQASDKPWMSIDQTGGIGCDNIYIHYFNGFLRSTDGGLTFDPEIDLNPFPHPYLGIVGTSTVAPDGSYYLVANGPSDFSYLHLLKSSNAQDPIAFPEFEILTGIGLPNVLWGCDPLPGGCYGGVNPGGLRGQAWIVSDHSNTEYNGNLYVLSTSMVNIHFTRSIDGGISWSDPLSPGGQHSWDRWFGAISIAPNGRIDVVWNDTAGTGSSHVSRVTYAHSEDAGETWSVPVAVSPPFDHWIGWPGGNDKLGDYYHMISDNEGVNLAYAATFNGGQDVYLMRIGPTDCNDNGYNDGNEVLDGIAQDCDGNGIPDECQPDSDGDGTINACDDDIDGDGILNDIDVCDCTLPIWPLNFDGSVIGDSEPDCDVDLSDYHFLASCLTFSGPGTPSAIQFCVDRFDFDSDGDIDLADLRQFQNVFGN
ncbi:MAG: exo-alpha-sialidase [Planctomycetes bacterium]|nr:exo-alpha-sialidase [Planctomycetota bacterium]